MAELSTIARPYAEALFAAARAQNAADAWLPLLDGLDKALSQPQVASLMGDPRLTNQQKLDLLSALTGAKLPPQLATFLKLVIDNDRLSTLPEVASQFHRLKNDAEGTADCVIESAFTLSDAQVADLIKRLSSKFPRRLKPQVRVEPQLIGGVRITVGDRVLDSSVRAQLDAMRIQLIT